MFDLLQNYCVQLLFSATLLLMLAVLIAAFAHLLKNSATVRHRIWNTAICGLFVIPFLVPLLPQQPLGTVKIAHSRLEVPSIERPALNLGPQSSDFRFPVPEFAENHAIAQGKNNELLMESEIPQVVEQPVAKNSDTINPVAVSFTQNRVETPTPPKSTSLENGRLGTVFLAIWGIGTLVFLLRFVHSILSVRRLLATFTSVQDSVILHTASEIARQLKIRRPVGIVQSETGTVPFTVGIFRPLIVLPKEIEHWDQSRRRSVLTHELGHIARGDVLGQFLSKIAVAFYWFHPLVWFAAWRIRIEREHACDDLVLLHGEKPSDYATVLLELADRLKTCDRQHVLGCAMGCTVAMFRFHFRKQAVRNRITSILDPNIRRNPLGKIGSIMLILFAAVGIATAAMLSPFESPGSADVPSAPGLVGVSPAKDPNPEGAKELPTAPVADEPSAVPGMSVELSDSDGKPCTTGYVRTYPWPRPKDWEGDQPRNFDLVDGKCFVPLSNFEKLKSFKIVLYPDGSAPYEIRWPDISKEELPKELSFKMSERAAAPIGGRIVDEQEKPVEGAIVQFAVSVVGRQKNPEPFSAYAQWIKTDADGYWVYKVLPKEQYEQNFDMSVEHAKYPRLRISEGQTFKDYAAKDAEGKFSKVVVLPTGLPLRGKIVDEQGNPIEGVLVHCNAARRGPDKPYGHESTKSDSNGEFFFENCSPKGDLRNVDLGFCSNGFAPDVVSIAEITPKMEPLKIVLKKGKKLILKAIDKDGNPLEGMRISSGYWKNHGGNATGTRQLFVDADEYGAVKTGKDGRFVWENAPENKPENRFDLEIGGRNYQNVKIEYKTLKYGDDENVYTFKPLIDVIGKVVDAETGEPIPAFTISEWFTFKGGRGMTREFGSQEGKDGEFKRAVGQRFGELDNYFLRVDADGYESLQSEDLISKSEKTTLEFRLKKATTPFVNNLTGTVLQPDGKPAANTQIGIATAGYGTQINGTTLSDGGMRNRSKTDAQGNFSISKSDMAIGDQDYKLVFLHDSGSILIDKEEFEKREGPITLRAWGYIEGKVLVGKNPGKNLPIWWTMDLKSIEEDYYDHTEGKAIIHINSVRDLKSDENGNFTLRVFPGKGRIGRSALYNNNSRSAGFLVKKFEVKPGETVRLEIGGGGYCVKGQIAPAYSELPKPVSQTPPPIDWRFAHVEATLTRPETVAYPTFSEEEKAFHQEMFKNLKEFPQNRGVSHEELYQIVNRWKETPEGKSLIEKNPRAFEKIMSLSELAIQHEENRREADQKRIVCAVNEKGEFQLDDLTPGNWTFEVRLNFPNVPGVWGDYADVWMKKVNILVPEIPGGPTDEPLEIHPISLGYEKGDRKGPER